MNKHIDAYAEYNMLVGEADGGRALPQYEYDELIAKALKIHKDKSRLYVYWRCLPTGMDCHSVGPSTRCFCGHTYKAHAWYETGSRKVKCRVPGCKCPCFEYIPGRGSAFLRCDCKHEHTDHLKSNGTKGPCMQCGPSGCGEFHSSWRCACGYLWGDHATMFDSRSDREAMGRPVENLGGWSQEKPHLEAACGGITRMSSLLHGVERVEEALPLTDEGTAVGRAGLVLPVAAGTSASYALAPPLEGTTAAKFLDFDRQADANVARFRGLDLHTSSRAAPGKAFRGESHRLGSASTSSSSSPVAPRSRGAAGRLAGSTVQARPSQGVPASRSGAGKGGSKAAAGGGGVGRGGAVRAPPPRPATTGRAGGGATGRSQSVPRGGMRLGGGAAASMGRGGKVRTPSMNVRRELMAEAAERRLNQLEGSLE